MADMRLIALTGAILKDVRLVPLGRLPELGSASIRRSEGGIKS